MIIKKKSQFLFTALISISIFLISSNRISAQEGDYIKQEKRNKENFLLAFEGFQPMLFSKFYDGSSILKTTYSHETNGEEEIQWITQTGPTSKYYGNRIYRVEAIRDIQIGLHSNRPPLNPLRIAGEILVGSTLGFGCSLGLTAGTGLLGIFVGPVIGSYLGVYLIGSLGNETGSILATFGGSILGAGAAFLLIMSGALSDFIEDDDIGGIFMVLFGLPSLGGAIGGALGFNLTRKYETTSTSGTSLANFSKGKMNISFPNISFGRNPFIKGDLIQTVNLLKVSF